LTGLAANGDARVIVVAVFVATMRTTPPIVMKVPIKSSAVQAWAESVRIVTTPSVTAVRVPVAVPVAGVAVANAGPAMVMAAFTVLSLKAGLSVYVPAATLIVTVFKIKRGSFAMTPVNVAQASVPVLVQGPLLFPVGST